MYRSVIAFDEGEVERILIASLGYRSECHAISGFGRHLGSAVRLSRHLVAAVCAKVINACSGMKILQTQGSSSVCVHEFRELQGFSTFSRYFPQDK